MDNKNRRGLTSAEAIASRSKFGANKMTKQKKKSFLRAFFENLGDPVIRVLLISLAVNIIFTLRDIDWFETAGIVVAILVATTVSTVSERSSHAAFEKLNATTKSSCRVLRDGEIKILPTDEVVVGDTVLLEAGEGICADGILLSGELRLDQSALTGESKEIAKIPIKSGINSPLELNNENLSPSSPHSCLGGCLVSSGEGEMLVCRVGDKSFLGGIVRELQSDTRESPLKIRLSKLAKQISALGYGAAVVIALLSLFSAIFIESDFVREVILVKLSAPKFIVTEILHSITLGLTVVIMAVPEGLPMMVAVVLSSNVKKMLRDNVLVKKSAGIEAAGSMNILFTDKTGTLTRGKMALESFILPDGSLLSHTALRNEKPTVFASFCENALYNSSALVSGRKILGGNATERALAERAIKHFVPDYSKITSKIPFDSRVKFSSATVGRKIYYKGAPEVLNSRVFDENFKKNDVETAIFKAQSDGKRVISMCESDSDGKNMRFICAAVIADSVRREAKSSVETLRRAGVDVVMITGDGMATATAIAQDVGILNSRHNLALGHDDLEKMTDTEIASALPRLAVVFRALPSDKSRLVKISQSLDMVVGMTGDGINDAPALRASDVGFAMGNGTDVAKEAGDVVILDNNLASIVRAVLYGRTIFKSIRKFLVFQLTMNFSSALVCMLGPLFGFDTPITVSQMLWVNMIMDTLGGLAFAGEAPRKRALLEAPKRRNEPILNKYMAHQIFISGGFSVLISMLFLVSPHFVEHFRESEGNLVHLSAFFALFIFLGVMQCINSRTDRLNPLSGIAQNPAFVLILLIICTIQVSFVYLGGAALRSTPLTAHELLFTLATASLALPFELVRKLWWRLSGHPDGF